MARPPKSGTDPVLADWGELRLIDNLILPIAQHYEPRAHLGDDCALLEIGGTTLAVSADVGPKPAIQNLRGHESDFESAGWHAVVATASDIATAGARPLFMTNCIDAPPHLGVEALRCFVDGLFRAYKEFGFRNAGGDIRHGPQLRAAITGVGIVEHGNETGRRGSDAGDVLVLIGHAGRFMSAYVAALTQGSEALRPDQIDWLRFPRPALREMMVLHKAGVVRSASDSSDGVIGAIDNIARRSRVQFELRLDEIELNADLISAAKHYGCDPWNIFFCWGDWSVATVICRQAYQKFEALAQEHQILFTRLGEVEAGAPKISIRRSNKVMTVQPVRNENFLSNGFDAGFDRHLDYMLKTPLFRDQD